MEKFKEKILKRTILMALIATLLTISYLVLFYKQNALPQIPDFIKGFQTGAFIGVDVILIRLIIKNIRSMKNENSLKKLYIEENDERKLMIMQKTGAIGMDICIVSLAFTSVIAGFFNEYIFFSFMAATILTTFVKGFFKIYYRFKF